MAILNNDAGNPQTFAEGVSESLLGFAQGTWARIVRNHQLGMDTLYGPLPEGTTVQDIVDALGTDAAELFELSGKLAEFIASIDAAEVRPLPEGVTYVANADGTVTVTDSRE